MLRSSSCSHQTNRKTHQLNQSKRLDLSAVGKLRKICVGTIVGTLINSLVLLPVVGAEEAQLAVVKSLDNQGHWSGITKRLSQTGVNYCIVDFAQVERASDLGNTKLLFLPNVELLRTAQLAALQAWMRQGGQVIVSGPTGTLSQPEIRNRLRSLLGAYWGFALSQPSTLEPSPSDTQTWVSTDGLSGRIQGGAVIPAGTESVTSAIWNLEDNLPAVVTAENSTFFGWRWGDNQITSPELDSAWLQAVLNRYEISLNESTTDSEISPLTQQTYCLPSQEANSSKTVSLGGSYSSTDTSSTRTLLAPVGLTTMAQELEELLGRFESALLAANATNSDIDLTTTTAIEQFTTPSAKGTSATDNARTTRDNVATDQAAQALNQARISLLNFHAAVEKRDYGEAGDQLHQARRTLWQNYPTDRPLAQPEIRAIWLDRGTIVKAKSEKDLARIFDKLAQAGFNTVFFETVNASYPIYPSSVAPEQNPLVEGWDPLQAAVQLAHERGMELHAWVWMFAAANRRHNAILNQPADYPGPVLERHPDWAIFDKQGNLFHQDTQKAFLDPANPEVRSYLTALLEEIASSYEVDGIQIDYIRYPFQDPRVNQTYGYGQAAREKFKELTGVDPIKVYPRDRRLWEKWTEFRVQQIDGFVASISERLREKRPELILSAAVFPTPRQERLQRLQQNWEEWVSRGDIDLLVPMTYALDAKGLKNLAQPVLNQSSLSSALILPAIRLLDLPDIIAVDQIQMLRDLPTGGYALFAVENLNSNLNRIFSRTQGGEDNSTIEPLPYRQPFPTAVARYEALQREWNYLLANNQISMSEPALSEWGQQADALSELLSQLAAEPSRKNLSSAKALLLSFRSQFKKWMQQQAAEQPYQVRVWDNRLATIERLLSYGERTALNQGQLKSLPK